ncbi:MAG: TRAP transporter large permease [Fusobacteriaceae bacterium]
MDIAIQATLILIAAFTFFLVIGTPISVGIGLSSLVTALIILPIDIAMFSAAQKMFTGIDSFALLAVPFFILSGNIMNRGGIALRLINLAKLMGGKLPGSLAHANVIGNMLFGAISGSAVAAAAAVGGTMAPLQEKEGYDKSFSAAVNIASAPTGLLIPPSGVLILYSLVSGGTSVAALFVAGYLPGMLMGLSIMAVAFYMAKKNNYPIEQKKSFKEAMKIIMDALPSLFLIVVVIGGIVAGIFTATEGAAVAVLYTFVLSLLYKTIKISDIPELLLGTVVSTGMILFLVAASSIMSWVMAFTGIPQAITNSIMGISDNFYVVLLIMNLILLIVGTFMDLTPAVLIFAPIFLPIATNLGLHPVHFGIILVFNLSIGIMTPPVGSCLFIGCSVANVKIESVIKPLIPMFIALLITLMMVTYIPAISLFLPKLFGII